MLRNLVLLLVGAVALSAADNQKERGDASSISILDGVFTEAQAERGKTAYEDQCATCHGLDLTSDSGAPNLVMPAFRFGWHGRTIAQKLEQIRTTMPQGFPESMSDQKYLDVIAYILHFNKYPAGDRELDAAEKEVLERIVIEPLP
jgi:quinoprotein glucose dehydrogenase